MGEVHFGVQVFAAAVLAWTCFLWVILSVGLVAGLRMRTRRRHEGGETPQSLPGVSIIKPLTSMDESIISNLRMCFNQDYPNFEVLLCLHEQDGAVLSRLEQLAAEHPRSARIFAGASNVGVNPKINNITRAFHSAAHDLVWICDASIDAPCSTLRDMVTAYVGRKGVSMAHQVPLVHAAPGFVNAVEQTYFATHHARFYLAFAALGFNCVNGMSNLVSRADIARVGGLEHFGRYIAEDYFLSEALFGIGLRPVLVGGAMQRLAVRTLSDVYQRQLRWLRLRRSMMPYTTPLEPFTQCAAATLLFAISVHLLFGMGLGITALVHAAVWMLTDLVLMKQLLGKEAPSVREMMLSWLLLEGIAIPLFVHAMSSNVVRWRGAAFTLRTGGLSTPLAPS